MSGVVGADREVHARVLLLALDQVVGHPRAADHVGRLVGADHEVFSGGHFGLKKKKRIFTEIVFMKKMCRNLGRVYISSFHKIGIEVASCSGAVLLVGAGRGFLLPHGPQNVGPLVVRPHLQSPRRAVGAEVYRVRL